MDFFIFFFSLLGFFPNKISGKCREPEQRRHDTTYMKQIKVYDNHFKREVLCITPAALFGLNAACHGSLRAKHIYIWLMIAIENNEGISWNKWVISNLNSVLNASNMSL